MRRRRKILLMLSEPAWAANWGCHAQTQAHQEHQQSYASKIHQHRETPKLPPKAPQQKPSAIQWGCPLIHLL